MYTSISKQLGCKTLFQDKLHIIYIYFKIINLLICLSLNVGRLPETAQHLPRSSGEQGSRGKWDLIISFWKLIPLVLNSRWIVKLWTAQHL